MHPGLSRPPACREGPGRVLAAPAVRSSQAQVHVTNFDYNHHPLNTMPGPRPASRVRAAPARGQLSPPARTDHAFDVELATRTTTWTDSAGTRARTLHRYELRIPVRAVGTRSWSTEEERQAFIGQSFSDLTVRRKTGGVATRTSVSGSRGTNTIRQEDPTIVGEM
jgi:hypothetical protein